MAGAATPIVSVVIPTVSRGEPLRRAVESALACGPEGAIEAVVVPNGGGETWREALGDHLRNPLVRVFPIPEANANRARNEGVRHARGDLIRFLDDDDVLLPAGAAKQHARMLEGGFDLVVGSIEARGPGGELLRTYPAHRFDDFCEAVASPRIYCLVHAPVFRAERVRRIPWDERDPCFHERIWHLSLCADGELRCGWLEEPVGVWNHHRGRRTSMLHGLHGHRFAVARGLAGLARTLEREDRLTAGRRTAVAEGIWNLMYPVFPMHPVLWTRMAGEASRLDPEARPTQRIFRMRGLRRIPPRVLFLALSPAMLALSLLRQLAGRRH